MVQLSVAEVLVCELLYLCFADELLQKIVEDSYTIIWRFAWIRHEVHHSEWRHVFL